MNSSTAAPARSPRPTAGPSDADIQRILANAFPGHQPAQPPTEPAEAKEPLLPWGAIQHRMRRHWRPWAVLGAIGATGYAVDLATYQPGWTAATAVGVTAAAWWTAPRILNRLGKGAADDAATKELERAAKRRRYTTWCVAMAGAWVSAADLLGLDLTTTAGKILAATLLPVGALMSVPYWRHYPTTAEVRPDESNDVITVPSQLGEIEAAIVGKWAEHLGKIGGKAAGSYLMDWRRVTGGWGATIVAADGAGFDFDRPELRRAIAQTYRVGISAVEIEPNPEDALCADLLVQRTDPLADVIRWDGPDSIDAVKGQSIAGRLKDGARLQWEMHRPGWGVCHEGLFGTTGSGKSEFLSLLLIIERWMHRIDEHGNKIGLTVSLLHDPQDGQSFPDFADEVAAFTSTTDEAIMIAESLLYEANRRQQYLRQVEWWDERRKKMRKGRKYWDPLIDGPIISWSIDEAHVPLGDKLFAAMLEVGVRMFRKVGIRVRVITQTPLLNDLKSTPLRDMILSGQVWIGRTANSLSGAIATNGRLSADPKTLPPIPGMAYVLPANGARGVKARGAWEPDFLDHIRDLDDRPIGYPAKLPPETLEAFGPRFAYWQATGVVLPANDGSLAGMRPEATGTSEDAAVADMSAKEAVLYVLAASDKAMDINMVDEALTEHRRRGLKCTTRTARQALADLVEAGVAYKPKTGWYALTPEARTDIDAQLKQKLDEAEAGDEVEE